MFEPTALIAALKPAALAVIACAMTYTAVAVDRWRLLRLVPTPDGDAGQRFTTISALTLTRPRLYHLAIVR